MLSGGAVARKVVVGAAAVTAALGLGSGAASAATPTPGPLRAPIARAAADGATVPGLDVSNGQPNINWSQVYGSGRRFAYVSAADGTAKNASYTAQTNGAKAAGLLAGAYFFAEPVFETGTTHADWFLDQIHYTPDGRTLPPALDVEHNTSQPRCDGVSAGTWQAYVRDFTAEVKRRTGADAVIYVSPAFWQDCVGGTTAFAHTNPLWVAHWGVSRPAMPGGWPYYTFWQTGVGPAPGVSGDVDLDLFGGSMDQLRRFAPGKADGLPYQVTGVDAHGLAVQSLPHVGHVVRYVPEGTTLSVSCQTVHGDQVDGRVKNGRPFTTWDRLTDGTFVYDWYMNTPVVGADGYSPGIPHCAGG
ncbi:GH25 family lysozyme [Actinoallomurus sp. NPDC050550]|uniref:GH25 family lysozyme n=1 Tax=Actinoallomurus sp. NPDC050550 TaxID=3154937 RepID=UPI00340DEE84